MKTNVHEQNMYAMMFVDACLGLLSSNVRCVAFSALDHERFQSYFVLRYESEQDRLDIKEILEEFWAKHATNIQTEVSVVVSEQDLRLPLPSGLLPIYMEHSKHS